MQEFTYSNRASRVVFGAGSLCHLVREIDLLSARRALVPSNVAPTHRDVGSAR